MNLTAIILLSATLTVSARGYTQTVTLNVKDAPLKAVFVEINEQTGFNFLYSDEDLADTKSVTLHVKDASLEKVLELCFKNQPLNYSISNNTIIVKETVKEDSDLNNVLSAEWFPIDVKGRVVNEKGEPVIASVMVKGTQQGTTTDANGYFELRDVDQRATLVITATNIESREIKLSGRSNLALVSVKMKVTALDEMQIIAYGQSSKRLQTGNVSSVKSEDIEKQPINNPLLALEANVPGLFIVQATGLPGSGVSVHVQGQNSIQNGNDPLYVIDGVPYISQLLNSVGSSILSGIRGGDGDMNPLNFINPADIESISVLKDADATAIYGSRAANGAILITTKKGVAGKTSVNFNIENGWGHVPREMSVLNTTQYLEMRHEAMKNDGLTPGPNDYDLNGAYDTTRYTDWQKALIGGTAQYQTATVSVSGGNFNTQYLISSTWHRETSVFPHSYADQKGSVNFNINSSSANQKFHIDLSGNYMVDDNELPTQDLTRDALELAPDAPALYNNDGSLNWQPYNGKTATWENPLDYLYKYNKDSRKTNNLVGHALLSYVLLPGLKIKSSFGYTNQQANQVVTRPVLEPLPPGQPQPFQYASYGSSATNSWIIEPQITYNTTIGKGKLEALAGATIEQLNSNGQNVFGMGYVSDVLLQDMAAAANISGYSLLSTYKYNAAYGRLNYNWDDKYLVDLTGRRDGSSRFGPANEFHNFGAAALGWIFTQDKFVKQHLSFLSFGKLTASYGTTGNDQIGDYKYKTLYSPTNQYVLPYQGGIGLSASGLSNPYLQWEETRKLYIGMNLGFFKDKILLTAGYSDNRSSNQLLNYGLPIITGFPSVARNLPATVQNTSWELTLKTTNIKNRDFTWTSSLNVTIPRNKLLAFPDLVNSGYDYQFDVGKPITGIKLYQYLNVDPATGVYQLLGADSKPTFNPNYLTDQTALINLDPRFYGGFENSFTYKQFSLDITFQFVRQNGRTDPFGDLPGYFSGSGFGNQPVWVLNRWQKPGDIAATQKFNTYSNGDLINAYFNANYSSAAFGDASFIRLKNLSLSWLLPDPLANAMHMQSCRIYLHGQNLLTITHFQGLDPENQLQQLPPLRVFTVGLQAGF